MSQRRRLLVLGTASAVVLAAVLLVPACRWRVVGWVRGEAFYRGRPTSYWSDLLKREREAEVQEIFSGAAGLLGVPSRYDQLKAWFGLRTHFHFDYDPESTYVDPGLSPAARRFGADEAAVPILTDLLTDTDSGNRSDAAQILGTVGPSAEMAIPALIERLHDRYLFIRREAARSLGKIGPKAKPAVPALLELTHEPPPPPSPIRSWPPSARPPEVREVAAEALKAIDPQAAAAAGVK